MTNYGRVTSTIRPDAKVIDDYSVWINSDIEETVVTEDGSEHTEYTFNQIRYDKDEYIKMIDDGKDELEEQVTDTQLALCEIYEMIGG